MPNAVQTIAGFLTSAGASLAAVTPAAGDSFAVPTFGLSSGAYLENVYVSGAATDFVRLRSPRFHDANQGMRLFVGSTPRRSMLPFQVSQKLYPADVPIIELDNTGATTGGVLVQYGYDDLPGVQPRLAHPNEVLPRVVGISGVEVDVTSGAIGTWGASSAINSSFDNFEAGADYAILGYSMSVACLGIALTGKDTGNLKIGGPGANDDYETTNYFLVWSQETGKARIPIIAANNKGSTVLQNIDVAAATATKVTLIMAQLS